MIDRLIAALAPGPQVEASRCLAGCTRCVQACPAGALVRRSAGPPDPAAAAPDPAAGPPDPGAGTPHPGTGTPDPGAAAPPELDAGRCTACGACAAACPADAIALAELDPEAVRLVLQEAPEPVLTCRRQPRPGAATVPCLAGLPAEFLAALALERRRPVAVATAGCAGCPLRAGEQAAAAVRAAAALVAGLDPAGGGAVVALAAGRAVVACGGPAEHGGPVAHGGPVEHGGRGQGAAEGPGVNRRGLLRLWRRGLARAAAAGLPDVSGAKDRLGARRGTRTSRPVPQARRYLLRVLAAAPGPERGPEQGQGPGPDRGPGQGPEAAPEAVLHPPRPVPATGLPLAHRAAAESCTACGLCAHQCPTLALRLTRDGYAARLEHRLQHCLDCGLCVDACPTGALRRAEMVHLEDLRTGAVRTVARVEAAGCRRCGRPFVAAAGELECSQCRSRRSLLAALIR